MEEIKVFGKQIFKGLAGMHEKGIAHRDLKPENILLKIPGNDKNLVSPAKIENVDQLSLELKICDLGAAKVLDMKSHFNTPYVVSRYYRAPELILGSIYYDYSIDVWATGCILFELITRTPMFPGDAEGLSSCKGARIYNHHHRKQTKLTDRSRAASTWDTGLAAKCNFSFCLFLMTTAFL